MSRLDFYSKEFKSAKMREMQRIMQRDRTLYLIQLKVLFIQNEPDMLQGNRR